VKIIAVDEAGPSKTGSMEGPSAEEIADRLGFKANVEDDPYKVKYSWGFEVDGKFAAIWDYKGSWMSKYWSTYDPHRVIPTLFPNANF
jgi:hypothetical protein